MIREKAFFARRVFAGPWVIEWLQILGEEEDDSYRTAWGPFRFKIVALVWAEIIAQTTPIMRRELFISPELEEVE